MAKLTAQAAQVAQATQVAQTAQVAQLPALSLWLLHNEHLSSHGVQNAKD